MKKTLLTVLCLVPFALFAGCPKEGCKKPSKKVKYECCKPYKMKKGKRCGGCCGGCR